MQTSGTPQVSDRINRLAQRPDIANAIRQIRADTAEADRAYAEREESSGYKREQFIERVPYTSITWHHSTGTPLLCPAGPGDNVRSRSG